MTDKPSLESFFKIAQKEDREEEVEIKFLRGKKGDKGEDGKDGRDGVDGKDGKDGENGKDGRDGKDANLDIIEVAERVINILPSQKGAEILKGEDGKNGSPDSPGEIIEKINRARVGKIKRSKVEGFDEVESIARTAQKQVQNFISLGGNRQTKVQVSGVTYTGVETLSFTAGVSATPVGDGTTLQLSISAGGFTTLAATETPNGSTTVFTFAAATAQPSFIILDGAMQPATSGSGTVNWTWNAGNNTATVQVPPVDTVIAIV